MYYCIAQNIFLLRESSRAISHLFVMKMTDNVSATLDFRLRIEMAVIG
jgi:hypothetical protein